MSTHPAITIDDRILAEELRFVERNLRSQELYERATRVMPGGVTSSWSSTRPIPVWISHGEGAHVWDVDGNEYVDVHAGYGVNVVGHANPAVVEAVQRRVSRGTHFAQPVEDAIVVAEALAERFGLPQWRFENSGTESTMDAIHLMRAITGRDLIIKIEGTYHGHHDLVNVSLWRSIDDLGPVDDPRRVPGPGIPQVIADLVRIVPFNDLAAVERVFEQHPGQIAGMIIEPMMMNAGIIPPKPGYLEGLRELTRRHGALLTFDEVKTGLVVAWGGATQLFGVTPDIVCLAKALGGGVPCGAIGGTNEVMSAITDGRYDQVGTFNGNPLTMAAARAVLTEVLTPESYVRAEQLGHEMFAGCTEALGERGLASYGVVHGFKGSVVLHDQPATNYREFLAIDTAVSHLNYLIQHNNGVFLAPWAKSESWTLSVAHTSADGERLVENMGRLARMLDQTAGEVSELFEVGGVT
ncbi:aspartate aminotransferase family protein [Ilumatobacter sp.]|uniref:aspartate aminotransferase family protein n=1 Tax=Ilumatobacter sp. TaxID=1967498 RepID=UPI0037524981